ncbi:MAG: HAMP domain-containing protein [Melioribacteraceae bacterium]|nr:HAMP domain-containing protein [Melioribacteraceae bacterium]
MKVFKSLGIKLIIAISVTVVVIMGVYAVFNVTSQNDVLIEEVKRHANQLSETIKNSTKDDMLVNRRDRILKMINQIAEEPSIKRIRILNKLGDIVYSNDYSEIGTKFQESAEICIVCHAQEEPLKEIEYSDRFRIYQETPDSSRILGIINPIFNEKSCSVSDCHAHNPDKIFLGVLDISVGLDKIDQQLSYTEFQIIFLTIISIVIFGLIIYIFLKRWVFNPIKDLIVATNNVASGNLNYKINSSSIDELGQLSTSFDSMTQKLSEMKLQIFQSEKMASLGQLAAGVAHEINNPLTGVLTYSSYLLKRAKDNPELQNDLNVIVRETKRSRDIVKQLLDFSRQSLPKKIKTNINQIIERVISMVNNQLKVKKINLKMQLKEDLPEITVDPNQIQQVILNLTVNAIDASKNENPEIKFITDISTLPAFGNVQIENAQCPNGHNLIDDSYKVDGLPGIKLLCRDGERTGYLFLSTIYGSKNHRFELNKFDLSTVELLCPVCNVSMYNESEKCPQCGSSCYELKVPGKGTVVGCIKNETNFQKWKYMDEKGESDYIVIKIQDNGSGIPTEVLHKIFDPFFSTKGQKGTGLGLSVVWGIIQNHKGRVEVQSRLNEGTTFTIRLPINNNGW